MENPRSIAKLEAVKCITRMIVDDTYSVEGISMVLDAYEYKLGLALRSEKIDCLSSSCNDKIKTV